MTMSKVGMKVEQTSQRLRRFWIGWSSQVESRETPFTKWKTAAHRVPFSNDYAYVYTAVVDARDRESAWQAVVGYFEDAEEAFVKERAGDFWPPVDRFPKPS